MYRRRIRRAFFNFVKCVVIIASFAAILVFIGILMRDGQSKHDVNDPAPTGDRGMIENGLPTESQYDESAIAQAPEELQELADKNPETKSFVAHYMEKQGTVSRKPLSEYAGCTVVPLLLQWDERWGYYTYGDHVMGLLGCGPTCLSMVAIYLLGDLNLTPAWMADYSMANGYYMSGSGTSWELMSQGASDIGLNVQELPLNAQTVADNLKAGNPVICVMGPGDFTDEGHYIVLTDWEDGMVAVNDPNSKANSTKLWAFEEIKGQIRNLWAYSVQ